jgi:hypothetical protein
MTMTGLHALLQGTFDYAGMFPPASLSLEKAATTYGPMLRASGDRWLLGYFLCPLDRLPSLVEFGLPGPVSLVFPAAPAETILENVRRITDESSTLPQGWGIGGLEIRVPADASFDLLIPQIADATVRLVDEKIRGLSISFELPADAGHENVRRLAQATAAYDRPWSAVRYLRLKIRTGGTEPAAVPSAEKLASFIVTCRDVGVRWKATAGLHHPIRQFDGALGTKAHGFMNLLVASALAASLQIGEGTVQQILEEEDASAFRLKDESVAWGDLAIPSAHALGNRMTSFGTCSIEEPIQHLHELGWL